MGESMVLDGDEWFSPSGVVDSIMGLGDRAALHSLRLTCLIVRREWLLRRPSPKSSLPRAMQDSPEIMVRAVTPKTVSADPNSGPKKGSVAVTVRRRQQS
jgi:hypothetical protein